MQRQETMVSNPGHFDFVHPLRIVLRFQPLPVMGEVSFALGLNGLHCSPLPGARNLK